MKDYKIVPIISKCMRCNINLPWYFYYRYITLVTIYITIANIDVHNVTQ